MNFRNKILSIGAACAAMFFSSASYAQGAWGSLMTFGAGNWPDQLIAGHSIVMPPGAHTPEGAILIWGLVTTTGGTQAYVYDLATRHFIDHMGNPTIAPDSAMFLTGIDHFCGGHSGDGWTAKVRAIGGQDTHGNGINFSGYFNNSTLAWEATATMRSPRWYPSDAVDRYGLHLGVAGTGNVWQSATDPERFEAPNWRFLNAYIENTTLPLDVEEYPFTFAFWDIQAGEQDKNKMFYAGKVRDHWLYQSALDSWVLTINNASSNSSWHEIASSDRIQGSGAVMFVDGTRINGTTGRPPAGKILKFGGIRYPTPGWPDYPRSTNKCTLINLDVVPFGADSWTPVEVDDEHFASGEFPHMNAARVEANGVLGTDGFLYIFGGCLYDEHMPPPDTSAETVQTGLQQAIRTTERIDLLATTPAWQLLADLPALDLGRMYHSTAVPMGDGSFFVGGQQHPDWASEFNPTGRTYTSPEALGTREVTITSAPTGIYYGSSFAVNYTSSASISRVTMVRLAATTHGFDQGQRLIRCDFDVSGSNQISVIPPLNGAIAPPGYYWLTLINSNGKPSKSVFVHFLLDPQ